MATRPVEASTDHRETVAMQPPTAANDDGATTRRWHQSGPPCQESIDATTGFLQDMWRACLPSHEGGCHIDTALAGHRAGRRDVHEEAARMLLEGPRAANGAAFRTTTSKRLGEPVIRIDGMRVVPDLFVPPARPAPERFNEVLVLRHESCTFSRRRTDLRSAPGHLAITRHALERVHERSLVDGGDLRSTVLDQAEETDLALAFAFAAGIHLGANRLDRCAATAIPFCDGLLLVQNRIVALRRSCNPSDWQEISRKGKTSHRIAINPLTTVDVPDAYGHPMVGYVMPVAATYVAGDMMRVTQDGYRDWFRRMMDRHRSRIPDLASRTASCIEQHRMRDHACGPSIEVPDIGRRMLGEIVVQKPHEPILMSIGWTRFEHPEHWRP
jgi:hypothetical protein